MKDEPLDPAKMMEIINRLKAEGRLPSAEEFVTAAMLIREEYRQEIAMPATNERRRFAVIVRIDNSNTWFRNAMRFNSKEAAEEYGWNQYQLHPSYKEYRVIEMPDEGDAQGAE